MTKKMIFLVVVLIAWFFVGVDWYVCQIKKECQPEAAKTYDLIYFSQNSDKALFTEQSYLNYDELKMESSSPTNDRFQVKVQQYADESPKLTEQRIFKFKELLSKHFNVERFDFVVNKNDDISPAKDIFNIFSIQRIQKTQYDRLYFSKNSANPLYTDTSYLNYPELQQAQNNQSEYTVYVNSYQDETEAIKESRLNSVKTLLSKHFDINRFTFKWTQTTSNQPDGLIDILSFSREKVLEPIAKPVKNDFKIENNIIYFPENSTSLIDSQNVKEYVTNTAAALSSNGKIVIIIGHTDSKGRKSYNYKLALKRAQQLKKMFINNGLNSNRLVTKSLGETRPMASNKTARGRQKNRRVEIQFKEE